MTDPSAELNAVITEYTRSFANRPRVTRKLDELEGLIRRLEAVQDAPGDVGANARTTLESYRRERQAIGEVQAGGELARRAQIRNSLSTLGIRRYRRHYAGQQRWTRDLEMLRELVANLNRWRGESADIAKSWDHPSYSESRRSAADQAQAYEVEASEVAKAIATGSAADRATALATRANNQFRWYRLCFAGKNRLGRRAALLDRMIRELAAVEAGMQRLQAEGYRTDAHDKNVALVTDRVKMYRGEVLAIRRLQGDQGYGKHFEAVAQAANDVFGRYRTEFAGKSRTVMDPAVLADLCDELYEVALHMDELDSTRGDGRNEGNLLIVLENLSLYENEVDRIKEARGIKA